MNYYEIAIIGHNLGALTFESNEEIEEGRVVEVEVSRRSKEGVIIKKCEKPAFKTNPVKEITDKYYSKEQVELARFVSSYYVCELAISLSLFEPFCNMKAECEKANIRTGVRLSNEQIKAYEFISQKEVSLLFGDTGSGKTEIYIKAMEDAVNSGKSVIFLIPEISLTPQMLKRLKAKFGDLVGIWHSRQSKKSRNTMLEGLYSGKIRIAAGPRSALFLPLNNIGLIVVDEEHDDSYKSSSSPRYNAKDMAITYAKICGAKCILGSATPSLASYKNYPYFRLKNSFFSGKKEFVFEAKETDIDSFIISNIEKTVQKGSQAIIFLPTRANFKYMVCKSCGKGVECPFCSVSMSLHLNDSTMKCHYCGYTQKIDYSCKECGHGELGVFRMGTQEAIDRLAESLPAVSVKKFDRDEITTQKKLESTLKEFEEKKISVLVGTQMLSKGHDYHDVKLAVILGLDSILAQNDFRARERALSLLVQISGRAGRKEDAKIIVQTLNGEFFKNYIADYELFLKDELSIRGSLYPPHIRMARLLFADKNRERAESNMRHIARKLENTGIEIVGFGEAPINKIAEKHRFDILIRDPSATKLLSAIYSVDDKSFEVDMDPVSFS
ncbi:MAG: primosomal protein N' [Campylobacteraceae bacterium]|nr:primosomal protein N' [Campylobacteraceae bacterium]